MIISIVLTIHNKEHLIGRVVSSIVHNTKTPFEFIIVYDGCSDNSEKIVNDVLSKNNGTIRNKVVLYAENVFETKANNIGMRASSGDFFILVQDDMVINEIGWESRLIKPMTLFDNVIAVTARTAFNIRQRSGGELEKFTEMSGIEHSGERDKFYIRDVVNRGPLALSSEKTKEMNYLDEDFAPYIWDDHDLCFRAYKKHKWICGSYVTNYISDLSWGTTRNKNSGLFYETYRRNADLIYERHLDLINSEKHTEDRIVIG